MGGAPLGGEDTVTNGRDKMDEGITIPVVWSESVDLPTVYANQLFIQYTNNEFFLIFGELMPPIAAGSQDERRKKLESLSGITIRPVVKLAISPPAMLRMAEAVQENMEKYRETVDQLVSNGGEKE